MSDPARDLDATLSQVADRWDTARTERTLDGLHTKQRSRKRRARTVWASGAAIACVALFFVVSQWQSPSESAATTPGVQLPSVAGDALHLQLADGSEVWLHDAQARVRVDEVTPAHVALELQAGQAHFDVRHHENRVFRVRSGEITVEVLGTAFELEREAARTRVLVSRGRVAVTWPGGRSELAAGEAGWFPRAAPVAAKDPPLTAARSAKATPRKSRPVSAHNAWREPAERGDFDHAYELLTDSGHSVADDVEELLLAADTARLSGHPSDALPYLRRVVEQHRSDSRAPLAAFTLGGVLMQQLGQPREAEAAFARARELSLNASLAEDALARQVEAAYRAGDSPRARALAREYLDQYPKGRRMHAVQRFGGLAH
ncbi:MAG TPA: FecR family protein [Polyangiales bacterium]|nr:FecR family protein [Polyangiales bacterium]